MALNKSQKEQLVAQYEGGLAQAPHAFLLNYKGIKVNDVTELRARVRRSGGSYEVVKNTLALRAIEGQPLESLRDSFEGPIAVAYTDGDAVTLAKVLTDFAKTAPLLEFRGGVVDGRPISGPQVEDIARLPSREELIAKLLFLLQSPITRFVRTLGALPRGLVVVLDQVARQKEG